jgi:hypothetical protein
MSLILYFFVGEQKRRYDMVFIFFSSDSKRGMGWVSLFAMDSKSGMGPVSIDLVSVSKLGMVWFWHLTKQTALEY